MKIKRIVCVACLVALAFSSCVSKEDDKRSSNTDTSSSSVVCYDVYQQAATTVEPDEFSTAMASNPIDEKMDNGMYNLNLSSTSESQIFFDGYIKIWQDELSFSINNLKKYLSDEDAQKLDTAQADWEKNWQSNSDFDRSVIGNNGIGLGSQYVPSSLMYLIDQYRERVFHIKYMTFLAENMTSDVVPQQDQLWNQFHEF